MASVESINVKKAYGAVEVLHGIDLKISDKEFVVLVGPSGCGKSTLLRMIAGLETVTSGEMRIGDEPINEVPPKNRDIAMVFQNYALYPNMTIAQNMAFGLKLRGVPRAEIDAKVKAAAEILGLGELLHRYPKQLSGGQRQRVAMGRAIVRDPKVFLFDEPLSNLDAKLRVQMRAEIKALHQRIGTTMIYVTHDQVEAMTMADRIVVMRSGYIEQVGTPFELFDQPQNLHVAGMIGSPSMNLIEGVITPSQDGLATKGGAVLPLTNAGDYPAGAALTYGIRPEHIEIYQDGEGLLASVAIIEPLGSETVVMCKLKDGTQINVLVRERRSYDIGQTVILRPDLSKLHLFDAETGLRKN